MSDNKMQDIFLKHIVDENIVVQIFLTNGFQMRGIIASFDDKAIIVENNNQKNMIYKHAISTITLNGGTKEEIKI